MARPTKFVGCQQGHQFDCRERGREQQHTIAGEVGRVSHSLESPGTAPQARGATNGGSQLTVGTFNMPSPSPISTWPPLSDGSSPPLPLSILRIPELLCQWSLPDLWRNELQGCPTSGVLLFANFLAIRQNRIIDNEIGPFRLRSKYNTPHYCMTCAILTSHRRRSPP